MSSFTPKTYQSQVLESIGLPQGLSRTAVAVDCLHRHHGAIVGPLHRKAQTISPPTLRDKTAQRW